MPLREAEKFRQLVQEVDLANQDISEVDKILGIKAQSWRSVDSENARKFWDDCRSFAQAAGFVEGERGIIINGRVLSRLTLLTKVIGPIREGDSFGLDEFEALQKYESTERIIPTVNAATEMGLLSKSKMFAQHCMFSDNRKSALLAAQLTSIMSVSSTSDVPPGIFDTPIYSRRRSYELLNPKVGVLEYGEMQNAVFQFAITLDPLSETAQKWSSIIEVKSNKLTLM